MSQEPITIIVAGDWRIYEAACLALRLEGAVTTKEDGSTVVTPEGTLRFAGDAEQATITATPRDVEDAPFWTELLDDLSTMAALLTAAPQAAWHKRDTDSVPRASRP
jgi:hypothetical protein